MADTLAVMEAVGSERAALMSTDSMGPLAILFAATHPDRTAAQIALLDGRRFLGRASRGQSKVKRDPARILGCLLAGA